MQANDHATEECTDLEERDVRALEQYLTVLPRAPDVYDVISESGSNYVVDAREGACTCPDFEYRDVRCKHLRRVAFATGRRPIPTGVDHDPQLGMHVDDTPAKVVATDGGEDVVDLADVHGEADWSRHTEPRDQGGADYWRCAGCQREILVSIGRDQLTHADGCPVAGEVDESAEREAPTRHEPADFGSGESTGVQSL
ncbi:SWIM zinc finger family protein [Halovivax cerinus]|uniref:SWIM zinc finger family protein n=1 Tax=Halovivax cerinus TaxID=1487865 RepID=A0ABD5NKT1_9EURY|nr:SWIM zinc finger family protein [Halovivax cerinus]